MISTVLIALSLSMDAFAVSVSSGICIRGLKPFHAVRASISFGFFQFLMPVLGWYLGSAFSVYISAWDHWIAFVLLAFIGGKMFVEALRKKAGNKQADCGPCQNEADNSKAGERDCSESADIRSFKTLLVLSIATSIDALAVGLSFSVLGGGIWINSGIIGGITLAVCLTGFEFGRHIGLLFEKWAEAAGGLILIGLGVKILIEHLIAA
ncbi:MAG: manganese efflux pump MntP family protein [Treponema sp.]|jgi:putative Mn2+ efflux pump MntP|nr:manganese efflux pump MntP family protein [Treponema sp.]